MDFKSPKVRRAVLEHINFAIVSVEAAMGKLSIEPLTSDLEKDMLTNWANQLRVPLISQILGFTLAKDFRLQNSMMEASRAEIAAGLKEHQIRAGITPESFFLPSEEV